MIATERFKLCENCNKKFFNAYGLGLKQWTLRRFCSKKCFGKINSEKIKDRAENKHPKWKGDFVGYFGVHDWISKHFGQPTKCEVCGMDDATRKYHWANLSGKYLRDRNDFKRMCVSCHRKYDNLIKKANHAKVIF